MKSQTCGVVLVFMVGLLAFAQGRKKSKQYQLEVVNPSPVTPVDECQKQVWIRGHGVLDTVTMNCEMAQYVFNDGVTLAIGDSVYSNKENELIVVNDNDECERRTYKDFEMVGTPQTLSAKDCEEVKKAILQARQ